MGENRKSQNKAIGDLGEDAAAEFLRNHGYRILERNHRNRAGEIDIIAEHRGHIVFVEVKTRSPRANRPAAEAVDEEKQDRIKRAARLYLAPYRNPSPSRFDIVSVLLDTNDAVQRIHHEEDAYR